MEQEDLEEMHKMNEYEREENRPNQEPRLTNHAVMRQGCINCSEVFS